MGMYNYHYIIHLCIATRSIVALNPRRAGGGAFPTMQRIRKDVGANAAAAPLSERAFVAAGAAVVHVTQHVPAMRLAAVEEAGAVVRRDAVAHVVGDGVAALPLPYAG